MADGPADLSTRSWGGVVKRTAKEFSGDNLTDWAAALTYYGVLSIFPALIALVSVLGLIGHSATQPLLDNLNTLAPGPARDIFTSAIQNIQKSRGSAGVLFFVGIVAVIVWGIASAAFALYVAHFSSYNKTYGALGGVVAFLVWLWISNLALLFGAELNAELERGRELERGEPAEDRILLQPRAEAD